MVEGHGYLPEEAKEISIKALEEIKLYREVGTAEECRVAMEKQKPMKFTKEDIFYGMVSCKCCKKTIEIQQNYCWHCGQAIEWSK